ncbi:MAG TPA: cupin domain-containing protein, partial [Alicycliphilus sp.]|nr:cupin domain-containing protein [Alicycliphilus sp.]
MEVIQKSRIAAERMAGAPAQPIDRLSALLGHFRLRAQLFHAGPLCGRVGYESLPGRAFLHVLRRGTLTVHHGPMAGIAGVAGIGPAMELHEPTVLLYARPLFHEFVHAPGEDSSFTCAMLEFDGAERNPIVQALPPLICVPSMRIDGLQATLDLLFAETDHVRCGSRVLADRLFEVVFIQLLRWILDHPEDVGITGGMIAGLSDARLARAIVAMHREPAREWTLGALAAQAAMS